MHHNKKKKIIQKYNSSSKVYEERYSIIQKEKFKLVLDNIDFSEKTILDAGCGTGLLYDFLLLKKTKIHSNFISLDISIGMINALKEKQKSMKNVINIHPLISDIENLPIRENSFDIIISITSLQNLPDMKKGLLEIVRVSKTGAKINLSILKKDARIEFVSQSLKPLLINLKQINDENLEDLIFKGEIK